MRTWQKERADHAKAFASVMKKHEGNASASKDDPMTPWAHNLDDLTHEIQHHMEDREKHKAKHAAARAAAHEARLKAAHAEIEAEVKTPFMDEIDALGRELCNDPARHDRPSCAQFLHPHSEPSHAHSEEKAHENA